jgi:hypothetical protein
MFAASSLRWPGALAVTTVRSAPRWWRNYNPQRANLRMTTDGFRLPPPHHRTVASAPTSKGLFKEEKKS